MADDLTADDKVHLRAIMDAVKDPEQIASRIFDYYHDTDRANRTSRPQMYLHMGLLTGAVMRVISEARNRPTPPPPPTRLDVVGTTGGKVTTEQ